MQQLLFQPRRRHIVICLISIHRGSTEVWCQWGTPIIHQIKGVLPGPSPCITRRVISPRGSDWGRHPQQELRGEAPRRTPETEGGYGYGYGTRYGMQGKSISGLIIGCLGEEAKAGRHSDQGALAKNNGGEVAKGIKGAGHRLLVSTLVWPCPAPCQHSPSWLPIQLHF